MLHFKCEMALGYFLTSEKRLISIFNFRKNANVKGIYNFARDPPMVAETLIMFFSKSKTVDDHIGDLEELFRRNLNRFGVKRARRLYWAETFRSIRPMVWPALKRLLVATAAVSGFKKWLGL